MPTTSRPREIWSTLASCLASSTGWCSGSSRIPVATVIDVVFAAASASATTASRNGISGAIA
jgi:hypothetical protein